MAIDDEKVLKLMEGATDAHIHSFPSHFERYADDYQLLKEADEYKMAGIVIKNHYEPTSSRCLLLNNMGLTKAKAYGGIVLNNSVGGLNPDAVESSARLGARIVWMPTADSLNVYIFDGVWDAFTKGERITVLGEDGKLKPEVHEIIDIAKNYGMTVATGHISPKESFEVCKAARAKNVKTVLTHPEYPATRIDAAGQKEFADMGVYIEKLWYNVGNGIVTAEYMADTIKQVGAANCHMATDRGQKSKESPVRGMQLFIKAMLENGISEDDVYLMIHENAERVVR